MDLSTVKVGDRLRVVREYPNSVLPGTTVEVTSLDNEGGVHALPLDGGDAHARSRSWYYLGVELEPVKRPRHGGSWYAKRRKQATCNKVQRPTSNEVKPAPWYYWSYCNNVYWCDGDTVWFSNLSEPDDVPWKSTVLPDEDWLACGLVPLVGGEECETSDTAKPCDGACKPCNQSHGNTVKEPTLFYWIRDAFERLYWWEGDTLLVYDPPLIKTGAPADESRWYSREEFVKVGLDQTEIVPLIGQEDNLGEYWGTVTPGYVAPSDTVKPQAWDVVRLRGYNKQCMILPPGQLASPIEPFMRKHGCWNTTSHWMRLEDYDDKGARSNGDKHWDCVEVLFNAGPALTILPVTPLTAVKPSYKARRKERTRRMLEQLVTDRGGTVTWSN